MLENINGIPPLASASVLLHAASTFYAAAPTFYVRKVTFAGRLFHGA
jgi:hypothetical protein